MGTIRGVIMDVDGTLVDSNDAHAEAWTEAMRREGYDVSFDEVRRSVGMGGDKMLPTVVSVEKDSPEGEQMTENWKEIFETRFMPTLKAFPNVESLFKRMREAGLALVVASSAEGDQLKQLLTIAGATNYIANSTSSSDAEHSKPDPDIIQVALNRLDLPLSEVLMLGDTPYDIEAAERAGIKTIAVRCGGWNDADLAGAVAIYDDPADLLAHFDASPLASPRQHT